MRRLRLLLLFVLGYCQLFGQTRWYLNLNNPADLSPSFNANWNVTTNATRYAMGATKDKSTIASKTSAQAGAAATRKILIDQWVGPELATQTVTGTLTGQIRFNASSTTSTTTQGFVYFRVINKDGTVATEVGTLTTTNLTTTLTNRTLISLNVGTLSIQAGQRFCIDVGWNYSSGTNTTRTVTASRGASSGSDMSADNTSTTANNPWIQFSQTLVEYDPTKSQMFIAGFMGAPGGNNYAVYNPADKSSLITLSNGNLTAQSTSTGSAYQVRSTIAKSSGKWQWECTFTRNNGTDPFFVIGGVGLKLETVNNYTGFTNGACITTDGNYYVNAAFNTPGWGAWTDGEVATFAFDIDAGTLAIYRNGTLLGTISGLPAGTYYVGTGSYQTLGTTTTNFGASSLTYPVSGYNTGWYK